LIEALDERVARHPMGHLIASRGGGRPRLEVALTIPLRNSAVGSANFKEALAAADDALGNELEALIAEGAVFHPGHVFCLRCSASNCKHGQPPSSRHIFEGYASSAQPRFADFAQWLLERAHPRLDDIYRKPSSLVTEVVSGEELTADLTAVYDDEASGYRIHGQVVAGWYPIRRAGGASANLAVSLQVTSVLAARRRRRFALNVLAAGPDGESLGELTDFLGVMPWQEVTQWGQQILLAVEGTQARKGASRASRQHRLIGMLQSMARRLEHGRRSRDRRTGHAEQRHRQGDRPTRMAQADLARAEDDRFLIDERRRTTIVLGERGRAHVFNGDGKLVTSIRYSPESIERKLRQEIWRQASAEQIALLRDKV
jgi:hypothetical protein